MKLVRSFVVHAPRCALRSHWRDADQRRTPRLRLPIFLADTVGCAGLHDCAEHTHPNGMGWVRRRLGSTVEVLDQNGRPVPNVNVSFTVTEGGGSVSNTSSTTSQTGFAGTDWVLGNQSGTTQW